MTSTDKENLVSEGGFFHKNVFILQNLNSELSITDVQPSVFLLEDLCGGYGLGFIDQSARRRAKIRERATGESAHRVRLRTQETAATLARRKRSSGREDAVKEQ